MSEVPDSTEALRHALISLRRALSTAVESFIETLDSVDRDPDLEPWLGSLSFPGDQQRWAEGVTDDREEACEDEGAYDDREENDPPEEGGDDEPSLAGFGMFAGQTSDLEAEFGGVGDAHNQLRWAAEHGDEGDGDPDREPSLGSVRGPDGDQRYWTAGNDRDLEEQHDGREPEDGW